MNRLTWEEQRLRRNVLRHARRSSPCQDEATPTPALAPQDGGIRCDAIRAEIARIEEGTKMIEGIFIGFGIFWVLAWLANFEP